MNEESYTFEKLMASNGFVPDKDRGAADVIIAHFNQIAREMSAPPAFYVTDAGYEMHPDLFRLLKEEYAINPSTFNNFFSAPLDS